MMPTDSNEFHCHSLTNCAGGDYCRKCSHAVLLGSGTDRTGRVWRWEFSPVHGPLFVGKRGKPLSRQPIARNHRAWEPFERWLDQQPIKGGAATK